MLELDDAAYLNEKILFLDAGLDRRHIPSSCLSGNCIFIPTPGFDAAARATSVLAPRPARGAGLRFAVMLPLPCYPADPGQLYYPVAKPNGRDLLGH